MNESTPSRAGEHLQLVVDLARAAGFQGTTGQDLLAYLASALKDARDLQALFESVCRLQQAADPRSSPTSPMTTYQAGRILDEASQRLVAQRATIEVLALSRHEASPSPARPTP